MVVRVNYQEKGSDRRDPGIGVRIVDCLPRFSRRCYARVMEVRVYHQKWRCEGPKPSGLPSCHDRGALLRRLLGFIGVLAFALTAAAPAAAVGRPSRPPPNGDELASAIDGLVPEQLAANEIPGAVVTVVADGETVFSRGYGTADPSGEKAMDPESTRLYTASEAKLFTAVAALQLVEQGELDLDTDVNDYLETVRVPETYPGRPITLRHLLTYTSGFDYDVYGWSQWRVGELPTLEEFIGFAMPERVRAPGQLTAYNNFDFVLAGRLIEMASGQDYEDYIAEHVFAPADMDDSSAGSASTSDTGTLPPPADGFRPTADGQETTGGHLSPAVPTGADVATTSSDMGRFMTALLDEDAPLGEGLAAQLEDAQFSVDSTMAGVGFAFERRSIGGRTVVTKDGDLPGVHHNLAIVPDAGLGIHVAYNGDGVDGSAFWAGKQLVRTVLDQQHPAGDSAAGGSAAAGSDIHPDSRGGSKGKDASDFAGSFEPARTSESTFARVSTLTAPVTVEAKGPRQLVTSGLSDDPSQSTQTWAQVGPNRFTLDGGDQTLAFTAEGNMVTSQMPSNSFEPLPWYETPLLHLVLLGAAAAGLLAVLIASPVRAAVGKMKGSRERDTAGARSARLIAWLTSVSLAMFATAFAIVSADSNRLAELPLTGSPTLSFALNTMSVMAALTLAMLIFAVCSWFRRWWGLAGRAGYSLLTLAAVVIVTISIHYRLIGVPLTVPI